MRLFGPLLLVEGYRRPLVLCSCRVGRIWVWGGEYGENMGRKEGVGRRGRRFREVLENGFGGFSVASQA